MNHDATHCADYKKSKCPKRCYLAQLTQDLRDSGYAFPTSWAHLEGTQECAKTNKENNMENKTISKQITKILQLCYQINSVETNREKTGNLPTVFLNFMGHTCQINIRIYDDGWMSGENPDFSGSVYLDDSPNDVSTELAKLIERLGVTLKLKARKEKKQNVRDVQEDTVQQYVSERRTTDGDRAL